MIYHGNRNKPARIEAMYFRVKKKRKKKDCNNIIVGGWSFKIYKERIILPRKKKVLLIHKRSQPFVSRPHPTLHTPT